MRRLTSATANAVSRAPESLRETSDVAFVRQSNLPQDAVRGGMPHSHKSIGRRWRWRRPKPIAARNLVCKSADRPNTKKVDGRFLLGRACCYVADCGSTGNDWRPSTYGDALFCAALMPGN